MHDRSRSIDIPLPDLSGQDALKFVDFFYELAGRFEASYGDIIERHYRDINKEHDLQCYYKMFGTDPVSAQLELFNDLEPF